MAEARKCNSANSACVSAHDALVFIHRNTPPGANNMTYSTFEVSIECRDGLRFIEVVACNAQAAIADVEEAMTGAFVSLRQVL